MLSLRLYQVFVLIFPLMISWNSVASSKKLWKRQVSYTCPNNKWKEHNGQCFLRVNAALENIEGKTLCPKKYAASQLAKIRSMDDLIFINNTFGFGNRNYYIGLFRKQGQNWIGNSAWQDGSAPTFVNYHEGQPTNGDAEYCTTIHPDLGFYATICEEHHPSICSVSASVDLCNTGSVRCHQNAQCYSTFSTFVCLCNEGFAGDGISSCTVSDGCPSAEWKEHKGLCYIEVSERKMYEDARKNCKSHFNGSSLAKIRYAGDKNFLMSSFNFIGHRWIGIRKSITWGYGLLWDDGSSVNYKNYRGDQPNDEYGVQDCMLTTDRGDWLDFRCNTRVSSFCSINAKQSDRTRLAGASTAGTGVELQLLQSYL